ncbi:hypothetical protein [Sphingobium mellinum]|uniref:hypothetical protein n=1 Tax=Sphingobium mellinum TaxID=1387166 RepID=UPI0030EDA04D
MAFDITKKRALETATIDLINGDNSPLLDDDGNQLSVTVHGPASKVWQQATAEANRRKAERVRKSGGRLEAAVDHARDDRIDFLCRVTISFNGWEYPVEKGATAQDMFRAAYADDAIGFIRDHVYGEANDWSAFTKGSASS